MNIYAVAAVWMGMALVASLISIRIGISVALVEIVVAAVLGNLPHVGQGVQGSELEEALVLWSALGPPGLFGVGCGSKRQPAERRVGNAFQRERSASGWGCGW